MLTDLVYNENKKIFNDDFIDYLPYVDHKEIETMRNLKVKDLFTKIDDGIYEYKKMGEPFFIDEYSFFDTDDEGNQYPHGYCNLKFSDLLEDEDISHKIDGENEKFIMVVTFEESNLSNNNYYYRFFNVI